MAFYELTNFAAGLDTRRSELTSKPGTLETLQNAHINQGAEIEKRKAFVPGYLPSGTGYTFGALPTPNDILVFGSPTSPANSIANIATAQFNNTSGQEQLIITLTSTPGGFNPQAGDICTITGCIPSRYNGNYVFVGFIGGHYVLTQTQSITEASATTLSQGQFWDFNQANPTNLIYQPLPDPTGTGLNMTGVVAATLFDGNAFVAAEFSDGNVYCFYNGIFVGDFINGLVVSWSNTDNQIAADIAALINATGSSPVSGEPVYTATANGNEVIITSTPTSTSGTPFTVSDVTTLQPGSTGALLPFLINVGNSSTQTMQAVGSFAVIAGSTTGAGTQATGSIVFNNNTPTTFGNASPTTLVIGGLAYVFASAANISSHQTIPRLVLLGASTAATLANFVAAVNGTGTAGVQYTLATVANSLASALVSVSTADLTAIVPGSMGNSVALSKTNDGATTFTLSGADLSGGVDGSYISLLDVNSVNILSSTVLYNQTNEQTAADVAENINANTLANGGYTASANNGVVTIYSPLNNAANFDGFVVSVTVVGFVCILNTGFTVLTCGNGSTCTSITINAGSNLLSGTVTSTDTVPADFAAAIASNIEAHGVGTAVAVGALVYISTLVTSSATVYTGTPLAVTLGGSPTPTIGSLTGGGVSVALSSQNLSQTFTIDFFNGSNSFVTNPITAQASGGTTPYTYQWSFIGSGNTRLTATNPTSATTAWRGAVSAGQSFSETWQCVAKDATTTPATSLPLTISIVGVS